MDFGEPFNPTKINRSFNRSHAKMDIRMKYLKEIEKFNEGLDSKVPRLDKRIVSSLKNNRNKLSFYLVMASCSYLFIPFNCKILKIIA